MRKQFLTMTLLSFCAVTTQAQIKIPGTISGAGPWADGVSANATSIVIGTGASSPATNVLIGKWTGSSLNNTGDANTFVGYGTGNNTTQGNANTFVGASVATSNITGQFNAFVGSFAGQANTSGVANCFFGTSSGATSTGSFNTFLGHSSGNGNQGGSHNTAVGGNTGFSPNLQKATAIGYGSQATASNTMILGGGAGSVDAVRVGIGTSPASTEHIHAVSADPENVVFRTTNGGAISASTLHLNSPGNSTRLASKNFTYGGNFLPAIPGFAPNVPNSNQGTLLSNGSSFAIGVDAGEGGNIHFVNRIQSGSTGLFDLAECLRIRGGNGFVGVHTRTAATGGGTGNPQALFHVNLTNPIGSVNTLTQGIRFEGLPNATSAHTKTVVIDANGNLAAGSPTTPIANAWLLTGNTTTGAEFIGTLTSDDFRIRTNNTQRARVTTDGNFDLGTNSFLSSATTSAAVGTTNTVRGAASSLAVGANNLVQLSNNSAAIGNDNTIDASAVSALAAGYDNHVTGSINSVAFGELNVIQPGATASSTTSQATGYGNFVTGSSASLAAGRSNDLDESDAALAAGSGVVITKSQMVAGLGGNITITNSNESVAAGEDLHMVNAHGCFVAGGHNFSDGHYNVLLGHELVAQTAAASMPTTVTPTTSFMLLGEQIHNNLPHSLVMGFNGNRAMVINNRGVAVKLDATNTSTYTPTVNFEVDASVTPGSSPMPIGTPLSNIRFHNLPVAPSPMPAVVIDPNTGELFQTASQTYQKQGDNSGSDLYEENERLKAEMAELRSQLSTYDEKFARLENALDQICNNGCEGFSSKSSDALYQSIPNPSGNNVTINYFLSRNYEKANISLFSLEGKMLNSFHLSPGKGNGSVNISLGDLQPGMYMYKLVVDGKEVGTRKLQKQ